MAWSPTPPVINQVSNADVPLVALYGMPNPDWVIGTTDEGKTCKDLVGQDIGVDSINGARSVALRSMLTGCPGVKILATSRAGLRLEGEALYHVPSLAIPRKSELRSVDELTKSESVRLFAERAALVLSGFEVTKENVGTMIDICTRLDGMPLAIELAAARVDMFNVEEIRDQLERSFDLLVSSKRSLSLRHRTLRASIDWSWNLLTDSEHIFMRHLSVFAGGWTLQAAQAICDCGSLELTSALVMKSLVVVHQEAGRETRYNFHEMVRNYAWEKLLEAGEEELIRDRHLEYFLELSRQFEPALICGAR